MAATTSSETWDAAWTLTARAKRKRLTDNISDSYPTIARFRQSGIVEVDSGGKEIQEDLMYALNTSEWFDGYDTLNTDAIDGITAAFYSIRYNATPVTISMTEEQQNKASDKAIKLITAKQQQSMTTAMDTMNAAIHGSQSGKSMLGLQDIVSTSSGATIGGINSTNETWWDNNTHAFSGTNFMTKQDTDVYEGVINWNIAWNEVAEGNDQPDIMLTTHAVLGNYENIFESSGITRWTGSGKPGLDGRNPTFRGIPIIADRDCAVGVTYMLQSKFLKFKIQSGLNFSKTPFREPPNQLAKVSFVVVGCQLVTNHRARQTVISGQTTAT